MQKRRNNKTMIPTISPSETVTRIDVIKSVFEQFMRSDCSFSDSSWELVEADRKSEATWRGDENHQLLKANFDEAEVEAKAANVKRKMRLNELREYERTKKE